MEQIGKLRPRWWTPELEERLREHLARGGSVGRHSLQRGLRLDDVKARILAAILRRPEWLTDALLEAARRLPGMGRPGLAKALGISEKRALILLEYLRAKPAPEPPPREHEAALYLEEGEPMPSPEELLRRLNLDPAVWEIVSVRAERGRWEMGRRAEEVSLRFDGREIYGEKRDEGGIHVQPLHRWRLTVHLRPRKQVMELREAIARIVEEAKAYAPRYPVIDRPPPSPDETYLLLIGLYDLHLGKLAWAPEVGENYDLAIAQRLAIQAVEGLVSRARAYGRIEQVVLPLGGDILHVDNAHGTTTAGTPQNLDGRWQKVFITAWRLIVAIVDRLLALAPVHIVPIPGNHDSTVSFFLGETLAAWYRHATDVTVDNAPTERKFYRWKNVLLWFYHGHRGRPPDWFADMANHAGPSWWECRVKEGILGHIHHELYRDYKGVTFRNLRSLSAVDAWHCQNFYTGSVRGLTGLLYHERGAPILPIAYYVWEVEEG